MNINYKKCNLSLLKLRRSKMCRQPTNRDFELSTNYGKPYKNVLS